MKFLKTPFLLILISVPHFSFQEKPFTFSKTEIEIAFKSSQLPERTKQENLFVYYLNLVRQNPKTFKETYLKAWVDSTKFPMNKFVISLNKELEELHNCRIVSYDKALYKLANEHALDMGKNGKIGHVSSGGKNFNQRINTYIKDYKILKEACQYGYQDGLSILIDLLIDDGIENLGHRKTLLDCDLSKVALSIAPHKKYKVNAVVEMGESKN
jgi:hypothetical protein